MNRDARCGHGNTKSANAGMDSSNTFTNIRSADKCPSTGGSQSLESGFEHLMPKGFDFRTANGFRFVSNPHLGITIPGNLLYTYTVPHPPIFLLELWEHEISITSHLIFLSLLVSSQEIRSTPVHFPNEVKIYGEKVALQFRGHSQLIRIVNKNVAELFSPPIQRAFTTEDAWHKAEDKRLFSPSIQRAFTT